MNKRSSFGNPSWENKKPRHEDIPSTSAKVQSKESEIIGSYSMEKNTYKNDMSSIKYVKIPKRIHFNLNNKKQNDSGVKNDETVHNYLERLNQLTSFIQRNGKKEVIDGKPYNADFVCTRGVLKKTMEFSYFPEIFKIEAVKLKNTIYLALKLDNIYDADNFTILGYLFENCLLSSRPNEEPGIPQGREFCAVVKSVIGGLKILFNVECDGIENKTIVKNLENLKQAAIIELKTRVDKPGYREEKHFQWLIQSHVAGIIDKIYEGKRDTNNIVKKMELYDLEALEDEAKQNGWNLSHCYDYLEKFLNQVKDNMKNVENTDEVFVYTFKKDSNNKQSEPQTSSYSKNQQNRFKGGFHQKNFNTRFQNSQHASQPFPQAKTTNWVPSAKMENRELLPKAFIDFINKCTN